MRMVLDIWGECHEVDSSIIEKWIIVEERLIGDTYFVTTDGCVFSCHKNFWEPFNRERKINLILHSEVNHEPNL
jgi:hypothetical protein